MQQTFADWQQHVQNHKVQRLDIAEVARLAKENEQGSSGQDSKLKSEDEKHSLDKSSNQTAGAAHCFCSCLVRKIILDTVNTRQNHRSHLCKPVLSTSKL